MSPRLRLALAAGCWLAGALILLLAPIGAYTATLATEVIILSLWAVSYNLVYGYMGEISFGHGGVRHRGHCSWSGRERESGARDAGAASGVLLLTC